MSSSKLPEEIYHEILIRLPFKSILRCKSVCKSWYSQISKPNFAKLHLHQNKNNSSSNSRLLLEYQRDITSIGYNSLVSSTLSSEEIEDSAVSMPYPFRLQTLRVSLLASSDGLVLLWIFDHFNCLCSNENDDPIYGFCFARHKDFLCVWNPATREYKKIPKSPNSYSFYSIYINGLAYDAKNDDYKLVVGFCSYENRFMTTQVEIFSLKSDSWEIIQTPYRFTDDEPKSGVLVNGNLHWLAKGEHGICIVYLDNISDLPSFKEIQLPIVSNLKFFTVGLLEEGCLCVVSDNGVLVGVGGFQVWEMKVYGVCESWTRRYVISNETIATSVMVKEPGWKIMWSFKNGRSP